METKKLKRMRTASGVLVTVAAILLGLVFVFSTVSLYRGGLSERSEAAAKASEEAERQGLGEEATSLAVAKAVSGIKIYTRAKVTERLTRIFPFTCLFVATLLFGVVTEVILIRSGQNEKPGKRERIPAYMAAEGIDSRLCAKSLGEKSTSAENVPEANATGEVTPGAKAAETDDAAAEYRRLGSRIGRMTLVTGIACAVLTLLPLILLWTPGRFPAEDLNAEVIAGILLSLPFTVTVFITLTAFTVLRDRAYGKRVVCGKVLLGAAKGRPADKDNEEGNRQRKVLLIARIVLGTVGVALVIVGCLNGSAGDVLSKATKICTECIGLG